MVVRSPVLRPGDRVRLVSPASPPTAEWLAASIAILEGWGLTVEVGVHAMERWGYTAGRDEDRLADLNDAIRDPGVRAIICTRGGAGAYRIADRLDVAALGADPKPIIGFSDITNLHLAVARQCGVASIHGCLAGARATAAVRHLLMTTGPRVLRADPAATSAAVTVPGDARGPLIGGNLRELAGAVGSRLPDLAGGVSCSRWCCRSWGRRGRSRRGPSGRRTACSTGRRSAGPWGARCSGWPWAAWCR